MTESARTALVNGSALNVGRAIVLELATRGLVARHIEGKLGKIPLGRLVEPEDIAALCGYLASEEGGLDSGQMIAANGAAQT